MGSAQVRWRRSGTGGSRGGYARSAVSEYARAARRCIVAGNCSCSSDNPNTHADQHETREAPYHRRADRRPPGPLGRGGFLLCPAAPPLPGTRQVSLWPAVQPEGMSPIFGAHGRPSTGCSGIYSGGSPCSFTTTTFSSPAISSGTLAARTEKAIEKEIASSGDEKGARMVVARRTSRNCGRSHSPEDAFAGPAGSWAELFG